MRTTMMLAGWVLCTAPVVHAENPKPSAPAQAGKTPISADDVATLNRLHAANLKEIAAGKLATTRARNASVKRYGELMIQHHTKADQDVQALASRSGVQLTPPPKEPVPELQNVVSPANFDRAFLDLMAREHRQAITQVESDQAKAANPELQTMLRELLPVLKEHHEQAVRQLQANPF